MRLKVILINRANNNTITNQVIQTNLRDSDCPKQRHFFQANYTIKEIDSDYFFDISAKYKNVFVNLINFGFLKASIDLS